MVIWVKDKSKSGKKFGEVGDLIFEVGSGELIHLLLRSPIMLFPTLAVDWKLGQAFTFNLGVSMGYNTVVNDYGERSKTFNLLFGTYF